MDIDDQELFSSANTDDQIPEAAEAPATEKPTPEPQQDGPQRDEHGRFAPKQPAEPAPEPAPQHPTAKQEEPARDDAQIPPWRLREMREERDAANQRYQETQRQLEMLQRQMPKPEPPPRPDLYENPEAAIEYGARQVLTPYEQRLQAAEMRIQAQLERNSRRDAFAEYGEQTVRNAYEWVANGVRAQDPDVMHTYNRAMQSDHPFDVLTQAFKRVAVIQQIEAAGGVDKWREQQLSQPQQQQPGRQQSNGQPQGSITKLPPSLRNTPSARAGNDDDDNDVSDAALFRHASR